MLAKKNRYMYEDVLDFFREYFLPDEPLGRSLGYTSGVELRGMHRSALEDNLSIALVSRQTNAIIGGRIIRVAVRNEVHDLSGFMSDSFIYFHPNVHNSGRKIFFAIFAKSLFYGKKQ